MSDSVGGATVDSASRASKMPRQVANKRRTKGLESLNKQQAIGSVHSASVRPHGPALSRKRNQPQIVAGELKGKNVAELRSLAEHFGIRGYRQLSKRKLLATLLKLNKEPPTREGAGRGIMKKQSVSAFAIPNSKPNRYLGVRVGVPPQRKLMRVVVHLRKGALDRGLRVEKFATEHGLKVEKLRRSPGKAAVVLSGTVGTIERAFNVKLARYRFRGFVYRTNLTPVHVPESLGAVVQRVSRLNTFRLARRLARRIAADPLVGTWTNSDSATQGIVQVILTKAGSGIKVHAFGACTPSPCDMGTVHGSIYADSVSSTTAVAFKAAYKFSFKITTMVGSLQGQSLTLETFDQFTDGSGRSNYYSSYTMLK